MEKKKKCPIGYVEVKGKCVQTNPIRTHHHPGELSGAYTTPAPEPVAVALREVAKELEDGAMSLVQEENGSSPHIGQS